MINILQQRIINQQLAGTTLKSPKEIVSWMGAIQAQDYAMSKWAVGVRLPNSTDESIEAAINKGEIIRTHVMRPTWHLVSPTDVRWMLALSAPHLRNSLKSVHKTMGLTDQLFKRTNSIIEKSLSRNGNMTRVELVSALNKNRIKPDNLQMIHIMFNAELNATVCNGPMRGRQFTYALLNERVPPTKPLSREESLTQLALRYFSSHGPATIQDFTWWSGLPATDAKNGLELIKSKLVSEKIGDQIYWSTEISTKGFMIKPIYFLPSYDEFMISYKDRSFSLPSKFTESAITGNGIFRPIIVVDGQVIGTWAREVIKDRVAFEPKFFRSALKLKKKEMMEALQPYKDFLGKK